MSFTIQGRTIYLPVEVREARAWAAHWLVPAPAAAKIIAATGLELAEPMPGKAIFSIVFVRYLDGDLDAYNEVAFSYAVRAHDAPPATPAEKALEVLRQDVHAYIHRMPVDQSFTLEAGRSIWGYPKTMAGIEIIEQRRRAICTLRDSDGPVLRLTVHEGIVPVPQPAVPTYTFLDGTLRVTRWRQRGRVLGRPRGATLFLADHEVATELRSLGLPSAAVATTTIKDFRARFGATSQV